MTKMQSQTMYLQPNPRPKETTMTRIAIWILALAMGLACGDAQEFDEGDDTGTLAQGFRGKPTQSFQFGARPTGGRDKCDKTSTGQTCIIPPSKTLTYCVERFTTFSSAEATRVENAIEAFDAATDFTLNNVSPITGDCGIVSPLPNMSWKPGSQGSSGTASNDVKDYAMSFPSGLVNLTEGAGVVGNYQNWTFCDSRIDIVDIRAKGTTQDADNKGLDHAATHTLENCLGIGTRPSGAGLASRALFSPTSAATGMTGGEACQVLNFTLTDPGQFNHTAACATD